MTSRPHYMDLLEQVASAQAGLITAAQLAEIRVPSSRVSRLTRPGGMWTRVLPGVHLIYGGRPDQLQREVAALLYAGVGSMLTGITALRHQEPRVLSVRWIPEDHFVTERVHVLIPHERRRIPSAFVDIERTRELPDPVRVNGLALTPPARALCDASRRMTREPDVSALVHAGLRLGLVTLADLEAQVPGLPRRGSRFLRSAIEHAAAGVWSGWEGRLRELIAGTCLPEPLWNPRLTGPGGHFIAIPDAWIDDVGLAVEVDSREHHSEGDGWRATLERQARYASAGVLCVPVTPQAIRDEPERVAALLEQAYRTASARVRPPVHASPVVIRASGSRTITPWGG